MMSIGLWTLVTGSVFLGELPDQSAIMVMTLAPRGPGRVWAGAALALALQAAVAVALGAVLHRLLGPYAHWLAGAVFLGFAVWLWWGREGPERGGVKRRSPFWAAFVTVFLAEFGDLTQWIIAAWAARIGQPLAVFLAAAVGLGAATLVSVAAGRLLSRWISEKTMRRAAAVVFTAAGLAALAFGWT